ncbi:DUF302 domain-containing protein [candidate division KSB1 bacterium]|nr:DUF302 domain-containing protein [candidate division KSB1 bacterium]
MVYSAETPSYGFSKTLDLSYEEALNKVSAELKELGFGIITEIDVQATMKKKLDVDIKPYKILGACNPSFAYAAIQAETHIGLFLPCNVIVYVNEDNQTVVSAVDPVAMMAAVENPELAETANKVRESLKRVIDNL